MTSPAATRTLPDALRLGAVHVTVTDLERSLDWYQRALGLRATGAASLGDGTETLVQLHEDRDAQRAGRHAGLYHFARLRKSSAKW